MRIIIIFLECLFFSLSTNAQEYTTTRKVVSILPEQTFSLNGGVRASFGGKSRVYLKIDLPPNTVEWYYTFTTSISSSGTSNLKLFAQLTKLIDYTGMTSIAVSAIATPTGVAMADIYLLDRHNLEVFISKADNNGVKLQYFMSGSRENYTHGTVPIKNPQQGTWYLGLKNPSETSGINVNIEVVAIVEEKNQNKKTIEQQKAELYGSMGWDAFKNRDYEKCIELSNKALELDSTLPWVRCNIALCSLIQNKKEYLDKYIEAITSCKNSSHPKEYLQAAIKDINDALQQYSSIPNAKDILNLLQRTMNSL